MDHLSFHVVHTPRHEALMLTRYVDGQGQVMLKDGSWRDFHEWEVIDIREVPNHTVVPWW